MAELVHRTLAVDPGRVLFHEGAHDIAGAQEVVLARVLVINGVESVALGLLNQLARQAVGSGNQGIAGLRRDEILEDEATGGLPRGFGSGRRAVNGIKGEAGGWHCLYHSAPKACPIRRLWQSESSSFGTKDPQTRTEAR